MGWPDCGTDSRGRHIGYGYAARCDEAGCHERIDRGLGFACGGMHGTEDRYGGECCDRYYCGKHLFVVVRIDQGREHTVEVCRRCRDEILRYQRNARRRERYAEARCA